MAKTPLQRALAAKPFEGNQSRFAQAIGTSQQNVSNWVRMGRRLPAEFVLKAEEATGIARHVWRPDIYPSTTPRTDRSHDVAAA
jgi:DNA-binding transcriptional regulator YdaS (Cro superfamily)